MTNEEILLVQSSWKKVLPLKDALAELFYLKLFELDPGLRALFTGDLEQQGAKLMQMITAAVRALDRLDALLPVVRELGTRHEAYGVRDEHYAHGRHRAAVDARAGAARRLHAGGQIRLDQDLRRAVADHARGAERALRRLTTQPARRLAGFEQRLEIARGSSSSRRRPACRACSRWHPPSWARRQRRA